MVVSTKNFFQSFNHQYKIGITDNPKLDAINRNFAIIDRRSGDEISIDITDILCKAVVAGNPDIIHPMAKSVKDWLAKKMMILPNISKAKDIIYAGLRPYLKIKQQ